MNSVGAYNEFLEEKIEKLEKTIIILKEKLSIYLDNDRVRAILPIGNSDRNTLTQEQKELLEETLGRFNVNNRLTKYEPSKDSMFPYKIKSNEILELDVIHKLGILEDLEEELGCPLNVVFKALKEGISCVDCDNQIIRVFAPLCFNFASMQFYWSGNNIGYPYLKDYQKTWWLKGEK